MVLSFDFGRITWRNLYVFFVWGLVVFEVFLVGSGEGDGGVVWRVIFSGW